MPSYEQHRRIKESAVQEDYNKRYAGTDDWHSRQDAARRAAATTRLPEFELFEEDLDSDVKSPLGDELEDAACEHVVVIFGDNTALIHERDVDLARNGLPVFTRPLTEAELRDVNEWRAAWGEPPLVSLAIN